MKFNKVWTNIFNKVKIIKKKKIYRKKETIKYWENKITWINFIYIELKERGGFYFNYRFLKKINYFEIMKDIFNTKFKKLSYINKPYHNTRRYIITKIPLKFINYYFPALPNQNKVLRLYFNKHLKDYNKKKKKKRIYKNKKLYFFHPFFLTLSNNFLNDLPYWYNFNAFPKNIFSNNLHFCFNKIYYCSKKSKIFPMLFVLKKHIIKSASRFISITSFGTFFNNKKSTKTYYNLYFYLKYWRYFNYKFNEKLGNNYWLNCKDINFIFQNKGFLSSDYNNKLLYIYYFFNKNNFLNNNNNNIKKKFKSNFFFKGFKNTRMQIDTVARNIKNKSKIFNKYNDFLIRKYKGQNLHTKYPFKYRLPYYLKKKIKKNIYVSPIHIRNITVGWYMKKKIWKELLYNNSNTGIIYISISLNNTFITLCDLKGNVLITLWAGSLGISGPRKSTVSASSNIANRLQLILVQKKINYIVVKLNGVLHSRKLKSAMKGLFTKLECVKLIKLLDITPKSHNGIRRKKKRKV